MSKLRELAGWTAGEAVMIDVEILIERLLDAYEPYEILEILFTEDSVFEIAQDLFPELFDSERFEEN